MEISMRDTDIIKDAITEGPIPAIAAFDDFLRIHSYFDEIDTFLISVLCNAATK